MLLIELTGTCFARSPKIWRIALVSLPSFSLVPVPWALMYCTSAGVRFASRNASFIATTAPRPSGSWSVIR
jgi:hypothetical protein